MKTTKTLKKIALVSLLIGFSSCSSDDDNTTTLDSVESERIENLHAPITGGGQGQPDEGEFAKFDFETGMVTDSDSDWDIAFRGTAIAINGGESTGTVGEPERTADAGVYIASGSFSSITNAEGFNFVQDTAEGYAIPKVIDEGWYNYNFTTNIVTAIPGVVLVFKTRDGKYAKVEIISYYNNQDTSQDSGYYTFDYVYNPNDGETSLE